MKRFGQGARLTMSLRPFMTGPRALIVAIIAGLIALMAWASLSEVDELVRARGQVIAAARTQIVQAADDGVIAELRVREGQRVKKGQLIVRLDDDRSRAAFDDSRNKVAALKASLARLHAEVYGGTLQFPPELGEWAAFRENQAELFQRRQRALHEGIASLERNRALAANELAISLPLLASGDVGQAEVIRLRRAVAEIDGQIVTLRNRYFQDAQADMTKAEEDLATQEEALRERTATFEYTLIRAPVDGLIKKINVNTGGASVRKGESILEILPTSGDLIVEAKYSTSDVASLKLGLPATVKFDAYDSSIYGSLEGRVTYISPDALTEPGAQGSENIYYRVHIRLDPQEPKIQRIPVTAGMTVTAEVRSQRRSILSYLTKPITKTLSTALNER